MQFLKPPTSLSGSIRNLHVVGLIKLSDELARWHAKLSGSESLLVVLRGVLEGRVRGLEGEDDIPTFLGNVRGSWCHDPSGLDSKPGPICRTALGDLRVAVQGACFALSLLWWESGELVYGMQANLAKKIRQQIGSIWGQLEALSAAIGEDRFVSRLAIRLLSDREIILECDAWMKSWMEHAAPIVETLPGLSDQVYRLADISRDIDKYLTNPPRRD